METYTISFFGHRIIENALKIENRLEQFVRTILRKHEYVEFLVGRNGEFDQLVSSTIRRCKRECRSDNSAHVWVLPYPTAMFRDTFELLRLEIKRYDGQGELIEEPAGFMSSGGLSNKETETYVHAFIFPDNLYADVQFSGVQYTIDRNAIQSRLCQKRFISSE